MQNYHRHSCISNWLLPDAVCSNEDYCKRAVELGHSIISSCEHGIQGNYFECFELAQKYGLKWRYVAEAYFVEDRNPELADKTNCHIILAAKTKKGIGDLNEALSEANISGYYYRPRVDMEILMKLDPKDVFVTTACIAGVWRYGAPHSEDEKYDFTTPDRIVRQLYAHFGDSFMMEIQYHDVEIQKTINRHILSLYRELGIPLIVGLDSHFIYPEQEELRADRLEANHISYGNEAGFYMDYPSDETVFERFKKQGIFSDAQIREAMDNTDIFLTFEDVCLDKGRKLPTLYPELTQQERNERYRQLVRDSWRKVREEVPKERWPEYLEAIRYEVDTITDTNMSDYFLLDYEVVKRYKELGGRITKTGRGSGPSFYTNTLLGFSSIDRLALPVTMYPDRFISKDRLLSGSTPDLDLNLGDPSIAEQATDDIMGKWHCAPMIAYGTLQRSSAWKMYCRVEKIPASEANAVSEKLKRYELAVKYADDEEEAEQLNPYDFVPEEYHDTLRKSEKYLGMIERIIPHACAHLLTNADIRREVGIVRLTSKTGKKRVIFAALIDGATADRFGYLKNDYLKVDVVNVNADIYQSIGMEQPSSRELLEMVDGDKLTWDLYAKGYTLGLNQVEKEKSAAKAMRYKPRNMSELSAFVAAIRPAFKSMLDVFLDRRHFDYGIPALDKLLQTKEIPSSFILYQEQMMKVLQYGGFTASDSYAAIKAIAKKHPEKVKPLRDQFLSGFAGRLISDEYIDEASSKETSEKVWQIISDACSYGFNSCLDGNEVIWRAKNGHKDLTIEEMYRIMHDKDYAFQNGHKSLRDKFIRCGYGKAISMHEDGRAYKNCIVDIRDQGEREVFRVTLSSGRSVVATANHKFPVNSWDNLIRLDNLSIGDKLFCTNGYEKKKISYRLSKDGYVKNIPKSGQKGFQHIEFGDSVIYDNARKEHVDNRDKCERCGLPYSDNVRFELHHHDGDRTNNHTDNYEWLCVSCHKKAHFNELNRKRQGENGFPVFEDEIISIEPAGVRHVYDVEMEHPYHNFLLSSGIITGNSHSAAVSLDSLYTAWAKAHHPYETYVTLMTNYAQKGDKERIDRARVEMRQAFGISIAPCRFRQDNRSFFIDKERHTISDTLMSVKHISARVADELYAMRDNQYESFVDLLIDIQKRSVFDTRITEILIRMGYFEEFGSAGKLMRIYNAFTDGPIAHRKTLIDRTKAVRREKLINLERSLPDEDVYWVNQLGFEAEHFGTPLSTYKDKRWEAVVLDVEEKSSVKVSLYNVAKGTVGDMFVKKASFAKNPLKSGDVIHIDDFYPAPARRYVGGKSVIDPDRKVNWLTIYQVIPPKSDLAA